VAAIVLVVAVALVATRSGPSAGEISVTARPGIATIAGWGFDANEAVAIFVGPNESIVDLTADEDGMFTRDVAIGDLQSGEIVALGRSGRRVSAPFVIGASTGPPTPTPAAVTAPPAATGCSAREPAPVAVRPGSPGILFYTYPEEDPNGDPFIYLLPSEDVPLGADASPVRLTTGRFPPWSPDYSQIAFSRGGRIRIASFVDGGLPGGSEALTTGANDSFPTWSANGCIAFIRRGTQPGIWLVNPDGTGERRLVPGSDVGAPDWSPDGLTLLYMRSQGGQHDIYTAGVTGSTPQPFLETGVSEMTPKWSPDGTKITYVQGAAGSDEQDVYVVDVETPDGIPVGTRPRQRTDTDPDAAHPAIRDSNPAWSPDGEQLVFYRGERAREVYRIWTMDAAGPFSTALQLMGDDEGTFIDPVWE
jgi:Tol biopolymer transport system component